MHSPTSPHPRRPTHPGTYLAWLLILVPLAIQLWYIRTFAVSLPVWDEWEFWWSMKGLDAGNWHHAFWIPHNEHRLVVTRVFYFLLRYTTALDVRVAMYFNVGLVCLTLWGLWRQVRASAEISLWYFVPVAYVVFSLAQWENVLWGWQIAIYAMVCSSVWSLYFLARGGATTLAAAIGAAVIASLSFANGLMIWPVGLIYLLAARRGRSRTLVWCGAAAAMFVSYFRNYVSQVTRPSPTALVRPQSLAEFFEAPLNLLGDHPTSLPSLIFGNIGALLAPQNLQLAVTFGMGIVLAFLLCLLLLYQMRGRWQHLPLSLAAVALLSFLSSLTIIVGRMGYWDIAFVLSSRYMSITLLAIVATYLLAVALAHAPPSPNPIVLRVARGICVIILFMIIAGVPGGYTLGIQKGRELAAEREWQRETVMNFAERSDEELARVYPKTLRERLLYWQSRGLIPFAH